MNYDGLGPGFPPLGYSLARGEVSQWEGEGSQEEDGGRGASGGGGGVAAAGGRVEGEVLATG